GDPMHGYMALVLPVLRGDTRYALKVSWIDDETVNEAAALALWNGGGAVRLLDADDAAGARRAAAVLANRDMHYQNVLAGEREPWLVIDPKVIRGDAEFGLAPLLWRRLGEAGGAAGLRRRFDALVDDAGFDAELARGWTLLRAVDYWLGGLHYGLTEDPALCPTVIDWLSL